MIYKITIIDKYDIQSTIYLSTYKEQQFWILRLRDTNPNAKSIIGERLGK
jgi:hypothetical protein